MSIKITVDTSDFNLNDLDINEIVQQEIEKTAYKIERGAKANCPVDTGHLRRSITTEIGDLEADIGSNVEYAGYVHDGTRYQPAKPFLETAANAEMDGIEDRIADAIERLLK